MLTDTDLVLEIGFGRGDLAVRVEPEITFEPPGILTVERRLNREQPGIFRFATNRAGS